MLPYFENVREQLLRAGIAPRNIARYIAELREHLADLTARERGAGLDANSAAARARALLGTEAELVQAMIDKTPRSLATRAPWAVFVFLPVIVIILAVVAIDLTMMHVLWPIYGAHPGTPMTAADGHLGLIVSMSLIANYLLGAGIAAGCIVLALRQRLTSPWIWVGLGMTALLSALLGFHMTVLPPQGGYPGGPVFSALPNVWMDGRFNAAATLAMVALQATVRFAIAAVAYRLLRQRLMPLPT